MPKIRDLGVKVIPETMRPLEVGQGGCDCSNPVTFICGCSNPITIYCGCSNWATCGATCGCSDPVTCGACTAFTCFCSRPDTVIGVCAVTIPTWGVDRNQVAALKEALRNRLEEIERFEATLGPQSTDDVEARETEIKAELERLKTRRKELDARKK
jgi:hypothetical protein